MQTELDRTNFHEDGNIILWTYWNNNYKPLKSGYENPSKYEIEEER